MWEDKQEKHWMMNVLDPGDKYAGVFVMVYKGLRFYSDQGNHVKKGQYHTVLQKHAIPKIPLSTRHCQN